MTARCCGCKQEKPLDAFSKNRNTANGRGTQCRVCQSAYDKQRYQDPTTGRRQSRLDSFYKSKYGITGAEYSALRDKQSGKCAICSGECPSGRQLAVDHCHTTIKVRGLLCMNCNQALGKMKDDPALLEAAAAYLRQHRGA